MALTNKSVSFPYEFVNGGGKDIVKYQIFV